MSPEPFRLAIIGAGPIGLEAALLAAQQSFEVQIYEQGQVAEHLTRWGHVRLFSPFALNSSELGRRRIHEEKLTNLPEGPECISGNEFRSRYLLPLSQLPELRHRIHEQTRVISIGKQRYWKGDAIGQADRLKAPFQLLLESEGTQSLAEADFVLDCSGTYSNANRIGEGGIACPGERDCLSPEHYRLPDLQGTQRARFEGKTTLVIGSGYSAATSVVHLARLAETHPRTRILWLTRHAGTHPLQPIENDSLPERGRLIADANRLAQNENTPVDWLPGQAIRGIQRAQNGQGYEVMTCDRTGEREILNHILVDQVIANVGYHPDRSLYEELQVHECYASQGPMKLAASLLGDTSADCLAQSAKGIETLKNPEPGFFILGAKSYGRDSRFLIKVGLEQISVIIPELLRLRESIS